MTEYAKLVIGVDSSQAKKAAADLEALKRSARGMETGAARLNTATAQASGGMTTLAASVRAVSATLVAGFGIAQIVQATDAWTAFQNRLVLVTATQREVATATEDIYAIAQEASLALGSTATVYQRFAQNAEKLGLGQQELARITETVAKAISLSGSTASSAEAALTQFGQALASGVLRGEEFNSVSEQAPGLLKAIAEGLGVNIGQLRAMAGEGKITADVLVEALGNSAQGIDDQFASTTKTIGDAVTELDNAFTKLVGSFAAAEGANVGLYDAISGIGSAMDGLSANADVLSKALDIALALAAGKAVAALTGMSAASIKTAAASRAAAVAAAQNAATNEGVAAMAQRAAAVELERARVALASAEADVAASKLRQAAAIQNLRDVQTALLAEMALEQQRLRAQISDRGRQLSVARMAELRTAEVAITRQLAAAEQALAATTVASDAAVTAAKARRAAATGAAHVAQVNLNAATVASSGASLAAAAASSVFTRAMVAATVAGGRALAFLGGPVGLIVTLGIAAMMFLDFGDDAEEGMDKAANATETASVRVRQATRQMINDLNLGDIGKATFDQLGQSVEQLEKQLADAEAVRDRVQALADNDVPLAPGSDLPELDVAEEKVRALTAAIQKLKNERESDRFDGQREGDKYLESLQKQNERLQQLSGTEEALAYLRKIGVDASSELGRKILDQAEANAKLEASNKAATEAEREAEQARKSAETAARQATEAQLDYVAGLERQATVVGMTSDGVRRYELQEKKLAGALRERADAALDAIEAGEKQKKQAEDLARLQERGAQLQKSIEQNLQGQRGQNDAEIGGYGLGARERERIAAERAIRAEYQRYQDELNESTPASMIGGAEYLEQVTTIQGGLNSALDENADAWARSQQAMGDWSAGASEAFANYMAEAQDIAGQTEQMIGGAMESLTQGIGDSFAQAIVYGEDLRTVMSDVAQTILSEVISSLIQMGVRYGINAALQSSAIQAVTATKTAADATMTASAVAATATVTTAQTAAAATTTTAWTPAAVAASIGSFGTAAAIGIAAVLAAMAIAKGFSTGGHVTGPGSGTSDDIPAWLSNGEFVTREAVVSQPGAKAFLESFNARGMAAVDDYANRVRHATGGLAGVPAPALPSPSMGSTQLADPGKALSATVNNRQTFNLIDSPERIASALNTPAGQEAITVMLSNDPAKFRSILGV